MEVNSDAGRAAISDKVKFKVCYMWSEAATWGGENPPTEGDSAFVNNGNVLCIDDDVKEPIKLLTVSDGATVTWLDNKDMVFNARYILVNGGNFAIGEEGAENVY